MNDKKKTVFRRVIGIGLLISICVVIGVSVRDLFLSPETLLKRGMTALEEGNYRMAERSLILATNSDQRDVSSTAALTLGELYRKGKSGFAANGQKAALFLEKAALAGVTKASYQLALMYDNGDQILENKSKALFFMNEAAKQGLPEALYALGVWVERGYMGDVDMNKVVALYEQAAEKGHRNAMTSLMAIYAGGFGNFPENIERSVYWRARLDASVSKKLPPVKNESDLNGNNQTEKGK